MALRLFFRSTTPHLHLRIHTLPTQMLLKEHIYSLNNDLYNLSPLLPDNNVEYDIRNCKIDLVDDQTWNVSSGLAEAWRISNAGRTVGATKVLGSEDDDEDEVMEYLPPNKEDPDLDEIEDMRIRGNLFYKLEKNSIEYEDHKFDFHRKKPSEKNCGKKQEKARKKEEEARKKEEEAQKKENKRSALLPGVEKLVKNGKGRNVVTKKETWEFKSLSLEDRNKNENLGSHSILSDENVRFSSESGCIISRYDEVDGWNSKSRRKPSFNEVTAPYHEPFCLDIYISKGSVCASVIHRATSKVVAVAHSISKDLKFDLRSPISTYACALVGKVLAQRAMADDIHNIVYTPRKEEKLEGKLQIVLQAIIDGGIEVKVKLKQRNARNPHGSMLRTHH